MNGDDPKKLGQNLLLVTLVGILAFSLQPTISKVYAGQNGSTEGILQEAKTLNNEARYEESLQLLFSSTADASPSPEVKELQEKTFVLYVYNEIVSGLKSISEDKKDVEGYERASRAFRYAGQEHRAMELLLDGVAENPGASSLWVLIGSVEMKQGREKEALSVYAEALKFDPANATAHNNSAYILATSNNSSVRNLAIARRHAEIALKQEPENPDYIDTLAEIQYQMGRTDEAANLIRKAITLAPYDAFLKTQLNRFEQPPARTSTDQEMSFDRKNLP